MQHGLSPTPPRNQNQLNVDQDIPAYIVTEKRGFFDDNDHLWPKGSMIYWEGTPSAGFEPLNEMAEEMLRMHFTELDKKAQEVSKQKGTSYASQVSAFESRRRLAELDRKNGMSVDEDELLPIMQAKKGSKSARSISDARSTPMMGSRYPKKAKKEEVKA